MIKRIKSQAKEVNFTIKDINTFSCFQFLNFDLMVALNGKLMSDQNDYILGLQLTLLFSLLSYVYSL